MWAIGVRSTRTNHAVLITMRFIHEPPQRLVRLSKRMSQLDLCSRREADEFILKQCSKDLTIPRILVRGKPIEPLLGQKVSWKESNIQLIYPSDKDNALSKLSFDDLWERIQYDTVVLNKPLNYLSGQPNEENKHPLAVQLLTPTNFVGDSDLLEKLNFVRHHSKASKGRVELTLHGYVPAGRLDFNSKGLLIFTKNGVVAKKLVNAQSSIRKEYIVKVSVRQRHIPDTSSENRVFRNPGSFQQITPRAFAPSLSKLRKGGAYLEGEKMPLKRLEKAQWINDDTMCLVLREGKKRQIRRMCSELMGFRVLDLERVHVGHIKIGTLPVGKWRMLTKEEARNLIT